MADNSVTVVGNLVDDPELRFTRNGQAMAKLRMANSRRWMDKATQQWQEESSFFTVTAWRELAENVSTSLKKGMRVVVTGRLQQRSWETENGEKRSVVEIQADEIGPSLRWATADVQRIRREDSSYGGQGGATASAPSGQPAAAPSGGGFDDQPWDDEPAF